MKKLQFLSVLLTCIILFGSCETSEYSELIKSLSNQYPAIELPSNSYYKTLDADQISKEFLFLKGAIDIESATSIKNITIGENKYNMVVTNSPKIGMKLWIEEDIKNLDDRYSLLVVEDDRFKLPIICNPNTVCITEVIKEYNLVIRLPICLKIRGGGSKCSFLDQPTPCKTNGDCF